MVTAENRQVGWRVPCLRDALPPVGISGFLQWVEDGHQQGKEGGAE